MPPQPRVAGGTAPHPLPGFPARGRSMHRGMRRRRKPRLAPTGRTGNRERVPGARAVDAGGRCPPLHTGYRPRRYDLDTLYRSPTRTCGSRALTRGRADEMMLAAHGLDWARSRRPAPGGRAGAVQRARAGMTWRAPPPVPRLHSPTGTVTIGAVQQVPCGGLSLAPPASGVPGPGYGGDSLGVHRPKGGRLLLEPVERGFSVWGRWRVCG